MIESPVETVDIRKVRSQSAIGDTAVIPKADSTRCSHSDCLPLVCIHSTDPARGTRFQIEEKGVVIGRDPECAIHMDDKSVSRRHASIELQPSGMEYQDQGF